jgi:hypothetical protein
MQPKLNYGMRKKNENLPTRRTWPLDERDHLVNWHSGDSSSVGFGGIDDEISDR